jgi:hypothetical protein
MSRESTPFREPGPQEARLLSALVLKATDISLPSDWLAKLRVQNMADDGVGSLRLIQNDGAVLKKAFGRRASEVQFTDADGVTVIASLNVDQNGQLFELDIWKVDFSPLVRIPERFDAVT